MSENLHTLSGRVCSLIELAGEEFYGKGGFVSRSGELRSGGSYLRLGKNELRGICKLICGKSINIIALDDANVFKIVETKVFTEVVKEFSGWGVELRLFFDEDAVHGKAG